MIDTFSANSLKILDKNPEEFKKKYIENLSLSPSSKNAKQGQNLHSFLCYYLKNFDTSKIEAAFSSADRDFIEQLKNYEIIKTLKGAQKKDIEQPFLVKCKKLYPERNSDTYPGASSCHSSLLAGIEEKHMQASAAQFSTDDNKTNLQKNQKASKIEKNTDIFYLTGRFDAVLLNKNPQIQIYDWKTINLPKSPKDDIQTIVYLYAASKLYKTNNILITYLSLSKDENIAIAYDSAEDYLSKIINIVNKYQDE